MSILSSGNVGIGTTAPGNLLDIYSSTGGITKGLRITNSSLTSSNFNIYPGTASPEAGNLSFGDGTGWKFHFAKNSDSGATKFMTIQDNGNVGIGSTTPTGKLHIVQPSGVATISQSYSTANFENTYGPGGDALITLTGSMAGHIAAMTASQASIPLKFYTGATERMQITAAGNVGINNSNPTYLLDVVSPNNGGGRLAVNSSNGPAGIINLELINLNNTVGNTSAIMARNSNGASTAWIDFINVNQSTAGSQSGAISFSTENAGTYNQRMYISSAGNVGIATTTPGYTLDVLGTMRVSGQAYTNSGNGSFSILSDARYKTINGPFEKGLEAILNINTVRFNYLPNNPLGSDPAQEYVGVTAQNLQKSIPEAVKEEKDGYLTVNTSPVIWTLINAIKDLYHDVMGRFSSQEITIASKADKTEVELLKAKTAELQKENAELKARLEKIEKQLQSK